MNSFKRNIFGYSISILFIFLTLGIYFVNARNLLENYFEIEYINALIISSASVFVFLLIIFLIHLIFKKSIPFEYEVEERVPLDISIISVLFIITIVARIFLVNPQNSFLPASIDIYALYRPITSLSGLYYYIINALLLFWGEKNIVIYILNTFILSISSILAYLGIRNISTRFAAIFFSLTHLFTYVFINGDNENGTYLIYELFFIFLLWLSSLIISSKSNFVITFITGIILGLFIYWDFSGLIILISSIIGFMYISNNSNKYKTFWINEIILLCVSTISFVLFVVLYNYQANFIFSIKMWFVHFFDYKINIYYPIGNNIYTLMTFCIICILIFGSAFIFNISRRSDYSSALFIYSVLFILYIAFSSKQNDINYLVFLLNFLFAIIGSGFYYQFGKNVKTQKQKEAKKNTNELDQSIDFLPLEIPIAMPARKRKTESNYKIEISSSADYDVDISEEDDYLI